MVLRKEAVRQHLLRLEEVTSQLDVLGRLDPSAARTNVPEMWAIERGLQLAAEILLDVGNHILSAHLGVAAEDYEDIIAQLGAHRVISAALRERLKGLGGFRNILVHGYVRLDQERVLEALARAPGDFSDFSREVRVWLESVEE